MKSSDLNVINHVGANGFGMGQIPVEKILADNMTNENYMFAITVTAKNDDWEEQTVTSDRDNLFVFRK